MKSLLKITLILIFVFSISSFSLANTVERSTISITESNNNFCIDLYKVLIEEEKGNLFISPYSISSALAMTYAGAEGNTKKQMAQVLHFTLSEEDLHSSFSILNSILNTSKSNFQLSIANSLWGQTGYPFKEEFLKTINQYYSGGFNLVDFVNEINREKTREEINRWVEDKTNKKIKELIHKGDLTSLTRLVLVNAIYFKGTWKYSFDKSKTQDMPFYINKEKQNNIPMMYQLNEFNYYEDEEIQALELAYSGDELSMLVILPKEYNILPLEKNLTSEKLNNIIENLNKEKVEVYLPKFKIEKRYILNDSLIKLGMKDAFDDNLADFSKITGNKDLYISKVIHQSFIEVNEEGTEAAAATAVIMSGKSLSLSQKVFKANHPFIFFILYKPTNTILFMGKLIEP